VVDGVFMMLVEAAPPAAGVLDRRDGLLGSGAGAASTGGTLFVELRLDMVVVAVAVVYVGWERIRIDTEDAAKGGSTGVKRPQR
jgi:hypothetical protein